MAYKFQFGPAVMSGSLEQEGDVDITEGALKIDGAIAIDTSGKLQASALTTRDTDDLAEGSTNQYYTAARARAAVSHSDAGGDGSFAYDSGTGVFTYTGPSAAEARAHFSAGDGLDYAGGEFSVDIKAGSPIEIDAGEMDIADDGIKDGHIDWGTGAGQVSTADIPEETNLFYTDARVHAAVSAVDAGGDGSFSESNGVFTYTGPSAAEARAHISVSDAGGDGSLAYNSGSGVITYTGPSAAEVQAHFSAGSGLDYSAGAFSIGTAEVVDAMLNDDVASGLAGNGLGASGGVMAVNVSGALAIASDKVGLSGSIAGNGLGYAGGVNSISSLAVNVDDSSLEINADALRVKASGVSNAMLANDSVTITAGSALVGGGEVALGGSVTVNVNVDDSGIEVSSDALRLKDDGVTLAKMAGIARGSMILGDASGDPSALAVGSAHQFFQSDGTDAAWVSMSGDVTLAAGAATIADDAVTPAKMSLFDDALAATDTHMLIADGTDYSSFAMSGDLTMTNAGVVALTAAAFEKMDDQVNSLLTAGLGISLTYDDAAGTLTIASEAASAPVARGDGPATLTEGTNFGNAALTADRVWTLPASPSTGDVVRVKAPSDLAGNRLTIQRGDAAHSIDGEASVDLESAGAAINLIYLAANTWGIF